MSNSSTITIDGSQGEGGGQILRSSLALAIITGRPVAISRIRANRQKPGLRQQHLTAVSAAQAICKGRVSGDRLASRSLEFTPRAAKSGDYQFDVGTAGSTTLVLQTILPPLLLCDAPSRVEIRGGTHNPMAPPVEFLRDVFAPHIAAIGGGLNVELHTPGFYPKGGGRITAEIQPITQPRRLSVCSDASAMPQVIRAAAVIARLPEHVAQRELAILAERFSLRDSQLETIEWSDSRSPGNVLFVETRHANSLAATADAHVEPHVELHAAWGERGVAAEDVAYSLAAQVEMFLAAAAPVGSHLADQLLLPMAIAAGGDFETVALTPHATTNIDVIRKFIPVAIEIEPLRGERHRVTVCSDSS